MNGTNQIPAAAMVGPNPGPSWNAIGTGDFNGDGHSDILWQNTNGQAAIWEMNGTNQIPAAATGRLQSRAELEGDRNRRLQRRRSFRHPVAEHKWAGGDLGNERDQPDPGGAQRLGPIRVRIGKRSEQATSTATASPTSCGRT